MYTVLIVEDEMLVRVGLRNMINWDNMNMTIIGEAQNGKQGLELYRQKKPDIILTDIKMPVMDGLELIREIREEDADTKIVVLSSYEDYDLVREAFKLGISDYILKLKMMPEEMENLMRKVQMELLEQQIPGNREVEEQEAAEQKDKRKVREYVSCRSFACETFRVYAERLHLTEQRMFICKAKCSQMELSQLSDKYHNERVMQAIQNLIENLLSPYNGLIWLEDDKTFLILLSEQTKGRLEILARMQTAVQSCMNRKLVFGVSSLSDSFEELCRLYAEATKSLEIAFLLESETIIYDASGIHQDYECILNAFEERMLEIEELSDGYQPKVRKEILCLKKEKILDIISIREVVIRWVHWASYEEGIHKKEWIQLATDTVEKIRMAVSLEEMLRLFEEYLTAKCQDKKETKTLNRELAKAISYIKGHYRESDISLAKVAGEVSVHKDYLSRLFKKELGIGFSDYVNSLRIKKARELLKNTHMRSYEITQAVGFQDESYFSRVFKKVVGVSPNEYKRSEMVDIVDTDEGD